MEIRLYMFSLADLGEKEDFLLRKRLLQLRSSSSSSDISIHLDSTGSRLALYLGLTI